ncbi:MAG: hypothetical protein AAF548_04575 [Actinomycetota bacterium]
MSSAAVFLLVALLAAVGGSVLLYLVTRARQPRPPDFQDQLRALAPPGRERTAEQPSGIVPLDPGADEELNPGT